MKKYVYFCIVHNPTAISAVWQWVQFHRPTFTNLSAFWPPRISVSKWKPRESDINNVVLSKSNIAICQRRMFGCAATDQCVTDQSFCATCGRSCAALVQSGENGQPRESLASHSDRPDSLMRRHQLKGSGWQVGNAFFLSFLFYIILSKVLFNNISRLTCIYDTAVGKERLSNYYSVPLNDSRDSSRII